MVSQQPDGRQLTIRGQWWRCLVWLY